MTVPPFRPYGGEDIRVVSDVSRFDYGETDQKIRSRNTTPTRPVEDIDDTVSSSKLTLDTIIPLYSTKINEGNKYSRLKQQDDNTSRQHDSPPKEEITPEPIYLPKRDMTKTKKVRNKYSFAVQVPQDHLGYIKETQSQSPVTPTPAPIPSPPPVPPPKDRTPKGSIARAGTTSPYPTNNDSNLPAMPQPSLTFSRLQPHSRSASGTGDSASILTPQQQLERHLIKQVMNRPVISIRGERFGPQYKDEHFSISANFVLYIFEVCCSVVEIVLSSLLLQHDSDIAGGYYRYLIADGIISLVIALLFALQIINYEVRNGSFYCLVATICKFAAFIVVITTVFPEIDYRTDDIWSMRRGMGAIVIISTVLWVTNMVMFVTTLYISRLNLLEDLNFDYSRKGINDEFNQLPAAPKPSGAIEDGGAPVRRSSSKRRKRQSIDQEEEQLKEFYLNQNGELFQLNEEWEKEQYRGKNKILVYTF